MATSALHISLARSVVTLNSHTIEGYADDSEVITLPSITLAETTVGADGKLIAQNTADRGGEVSIKLMPKSTSATYFFKEFIKILNGDDIVWNGTVSYGPGNPRVTLSNGVMTEGPA